MYEGIEFSEMSADDQALEAVLIQSRLGALVRVTFNLEGDDSIDRYFHPSELPSLLWHPGVGEQVEGIVVHWEGLNARAYDMSFVPWERSPEYVGKMLGDVEGDGWLPG